MRQNVVLIIFHIQNIYHHVWKTVRTTLQWIVGLQSRGEGHRVAKSKKHRNPALNESHHHHHHLLFLQLWKVNKWRKTVGQNRPIVFLAFQTFSLGLENNKKTKVCFWEFSMHGDLYFVCGKLSELHLDKQLLLKLRGHCSIILENSPDQGSASAT